MKLNDEQKFQIFCAALQATIAAHKDYELAVFHARGYTAVAIKEIEEKDFHPEPLDERSDELPAFPG